MNKFFSITLFILISVQVSFAQKYFTKTGHISFFSEASLEKIEAHNKSSNCVLDLASGKIEFATLIKGFQFDKALMQEHFNENYLESNKFPKAIFKGQIDNYKTIDVSKNAKIPVKVTGNMTMHGVTKKITTDGILVVNNGKIDADATFDVLLADYDITIPAVVKDQVAKSVKIVVDTTLEPFK